VSDDVVYLTVHFPNGDRGGLACAAVGAGQYRLHESELLSERPLYLDEIVQLEPRPNGEFTFVRRIARSRLRRSCHTLSEDQANAPELKTFLAAVTAAGGQWEVFFRGVLLLHLPPESDFDVHSNWANVFRSAPPEA
jgi:hypothetical protein